MNRKASSLGTVSEPVSSFSGKCMAAKSLRKSGRWNRKAALHDASPLLPYSRSSRANEYRSGPTLYVTFLRENGSAALSMLTKPNWVTVARHAFSASNSSQSALDAPELEELELSPLVDEELSLQVDCGTLVSAAAERNASWTNLRLFISSSAHHGLSGGMCEMRRARNVGGR